MGKPRCTIRKVLVHLTDPAYFGQLVTPNVDTLPVPYSSIRSRIVHTTFFIIPLSVSFIMHVCPSPRSS